MLDKPLRFTTPMLVHLIRRRGGEPHNTISASPVFYDEQAQRRIDESINADLAEHGLLGPRGIDRGLLQTIEAIARPDVECFGWFEGTYPDSPPSFSVLAGSRGGDAFVLVRAIREEMIAVLPARSDRLIEHFTNEIPPAEPGAGGEVSAGKAEYLGGRAPMPDGDEGSIFESPRPSRGPASGAQEIRRLLALPRVGAGTLYAAARSRAGTRTRARQPINFIDTEEGRWLMAERPGRGDSSIVLTPATPRLLGQQLRNALSTVT